MLASWLPSERRSRASPALTVATASCRSLLPQSVSSPTILVSFADTGYAITTDPVRISVRHVRYAGSVAERLNRETPVSLLCRRMPRSRDTGGARYGLAVPRNFVCAAPQTAATCGGLP